MKKRPINRCLFPVLLILIFFIVELYILGESKKEMLDAADKALVEAVDVDLKNRWEKSTEPNCFYDNGKKRPLKWPRQVLIMTEGGIKHVTIDTLRDLANINDFKSENIKRSQQSALYRTHPIILDSLQFIFEKELKKKSIYSTTALRLSYNWLNEYHSWQTIDSLELTNYYMLKKYCIGEFSEFDLYSYIKISNIQKILYSLHSSKLNISICIIFIISIIISISYLIYSSKKNIQYNHFQITSHLYKLNDLVSYNTTTYELKIGDESKILRQQLGLLLSFFIKAPNHEANVDDIRKSIWKKSTCTNETLSHAISCLRKYLPESTQIRITKINADTYKLIIENNTINSGKTK